MVTCARRAFINRHSRTASLCQFERFFYTQKAQILTKKNNSKKCSDWAKNVIPSPPQADLIYNPLPNFTIIAALSDWKTSA